MPATVPLINVRPLGAVGLVRSMLTVCVALALALPAASVVKYTTLWLALSPLTLNVAEAPAVEV